MVDIRNLIAQYSGIDASNIKDDMIFGKDIIIDSIDFGEIMLIIKKNYPDADIQTLFKAKNLADISAILHKNTI